MGATVGDLVGASLNVDDDVLLGVFIPGTSQGHSVVLEGFNSMENIFWLRAVLEEDTVVEPTSDDVVPEGYVRVRIETEVVIQKERVQRYAAIFRGAADEAGSKLTTTTKIEEVPA